MNPEHIRLMHEVLDGEASADEQRELDRLLAADAAARAEFEELRALFEGLKAAAKEAPPETLLADVMAEVAPKHRRRHRMRQLSSRWRVLVSDVARGRSKAPQRVVPTHKSFQGEHNRGNADMSELTSKHKIWIGAGVAAVAVVIVSRYFDFPASHDMSGTIAPASRSVAEQPGAGDVTGTSQSGAQSTEVAAGDAARDSATDAVKVQDQVHDFARGKALDSIKASDRAMDASKQDSLRDRAMDASKTNDRAMDASKQDSLRDRAMDASKTNDRAMDASKQDSLRDRAMDASKTNDAAMDAAKHQ
jgi:hypothetical protein